MDNTPQFFEMPATETEAARRITYRVTEGAGPTLVFLPGYMSDMAGGKATALFEWALANGADAARRRGAWR